jgi:hypothetical protein
LFSISSQQVSFPQLMNLELGADGLTYLTGVLFIGMIIYSTRPKRTTAHHNTFLSSSYYYPLLSIIGPSTLVATLVVYGFYSRTKPAVEDIKT